MLWKVITGIVLATLLLIVFLYKYPQTLHTPHFIKEQADSQLPYPTLEKIFADDHSWITTLSAQKKVTLIATGDIIPARSVNLQTIKNKDSLWPFKNIAETLKSADLTFINLETPLIVNCPPTDEGMVFCGDVRHLQGLVASGVDVASLANNHAGNHGEKGVQDTVKLLETQGILTTGVNDATHSAVVKQVKGIKFGFLGYNDIATPQPGVLNVNLDRIKSDIAKLKTQTDVVIVTYHWGVEYRAQPDERQKLLGHFTIDNGADLVIGNHPHWIQPVEFYKGKLISYAHGNTVFDQEWSQKTREGVIGVYTFFNKKLVDVQYLPLQIDNYGQPHFATDPQRKNILEDMRQQSIILSKL